MRSIKLGLFGSAAFVAALGVLASAANANAGAAKRGTPTQRSAAPPTSATEARQLAPLTTFYRLLDKDEKVARAALREISWSWQPSSAAILIQMVGCIEHRGVQTDAIALFERASGRTYPANDPAEQIDARRQSQQRLWTTLASCLRELPERTREVFELRTLLELDLPVVCRRLGITCNHGGVLAYRARAHIRRRWLSAST